MYVWWCKGYKGWSRILHQIVGSTHSRRGRVPYSERPVSKLLLLRLLGSACTCGGAKVTRAGPGFSTRWGSTHSRRGRVPYSERPVSKLLLLLWLLSSAWQFSWTCGERGHSTRARSVFENENVSLMKIRYNFLGITDKNINFVPCQFQNRNWKYCFY